MNLPTFGQRGAQPRASSRTCATRVLILSASVGMGHVRAAEAIESAVREVAPAVTVQNVDVLGLTNAAFRRAYRDSYLALINHAPWLFGYFYDLFDRPTPPAWAADRLRLAVEQFNLSRLRRVVEGTPWDVVVSTHFLPAGLIASLRRQAHITTPHVTATTDFDAHRLWVNQPCDHYCAATEEAAAYLHSWGVPRADITITGIPIHPVFARPKPRDLCLTRQHLPGDRPIVLQLAGGFGVGPIKDIHRALLGIEIPLDIVVVAGRNEEARRRLLDMPPDRTHRRHIRGFVTDVDELMQVADVVVSKPGGLTTAEVLARGAVMAVVHPVPGHEARNSDYVLEHGAGVKVNSLGTLAWKLTGLLRSPERLARLKRHARHAARPRAAFVIARLALTVGSAALHGSRPTAGPSDRDARPDVPPSPRRTRR